MGSMISSIKRGLESVSRFKRTVTEMRQNLSDVQHCTRDIVRMVNNLHTISFEVKETVSQCSMEIHRTLCEQIYKQFSDEDIENLSHIVFYDECISKLNEMQKIDGTISSGDFLAHLFYETIARIREYEEHWREDKTKFELLLGLEKYLDESLRFRIDTFTSFDENTTMESNLDSTYKAVEKSYSAEFEEQCDIEVKDEEWIPMNLLENKKSFSYRPKMAKERQQCRQRKGVRIWKLKQKQLQNAAKKMKNLEVFCDLLKHQNELHSRLNDHLAKQKGKMLDPVKSVFIKRIIEGGDIFQVENEKYSPCMAKFNAALEKIIKKGDLRNLNLKLNIKYDVNMKELVPVIENATLKIENMKEDIVSNIDSVRAALLIDIKAMQNDHEPEMPDRRESLAIIPFQETLNLVKDKSADKLESNVEEFVIKSGLAEKIRKENLLKFAQIPLSERETKRMIRKVIQQKASQREIEYAGFFFNLLATTIRENIANGDCTKEDALFIILDALQRNLNFERSSFLESEKDTFVASNEALVKFKDLVTNIMASNELPGFILHKVLNQEEISSALVNKALALFIQEAFGREKSVPLQMAWKYLPKKRLSPEFFVELERLLSQNAKSEQVAVAINIIKELVKIKENRVTIMELLGPQY
eukprot:gene13962-4922_t